MCSSKSKPQGSTATDIVVVSHINGRPVLQPNCNRSPLLERRNSLKKSSTNKSFATNLQVPISSTSPVSTNIGKVKPAVTTPPASPKLKSPRQPAIKRGNDPNGLNSSVEKVILSTPKCNGNKIVADPVKKSKNSNNGVSLDNSPLKNISSSLIVEAPGSIAAARREQVAIMQVQRKMRIAHYGRTKSAKYERKIVPLDSSATAAISVKEERRCHFISSNSGRFILSSFPFCLITKYFMNACEIRRT